jgi:glycosyltransferase involved in cell wall biosynthesis
MAVSEVITPSEARMPASLPRLSYYSYDSLGNPWLSGGGALRDFEILKRQRAAWQDITVWTGSYPGFKESVREGVRYRSLGLPGFSRGYLASRLAFTLAANLRVLFDRAERIGNSLSAYAPLLAGLLRPDRFFLVAHHYVGAGSKEKYSLMGSLAWLSEWLLLRFCRRLIASNAKVAARARSMNARVRVLQTQNGFAADLLAAIPEESEPPFILFLGRFDIYMKGLDRLVAAYRGLRPDLTSRVRLVLAGAASPKALAAVEALAGKNPQGSAKAGAEGGAQGRIELIPNVPEARKRELLRTCLFFCSPSRFEGWGIAALEANAAGKAVLVTRADGFLDSIKDGYSGIMVDVDDAPALAAGLERLIEDAALRRRLGSDAREWASRFTWDGIAERERQWLEPLGP